MANSLSGASAKSAGRLMVRGAMETLMELCKPEMESRLVEAALSAVHSAIVKRPAIAVVISDYTESLQTMVDDLDSGPCFQVA